MVSVCGVIDERWCTRCRMQKDACHMHATSRAPVVPWPPYRKDADARYPYRRPTRHQYGQQESLP